MPRTNRGVIKILFIIIAAILILSYFRVNLRELFNPSNFSINSTSVWRFLKMVWGDFLISPMIFLLEKLLEILKSLI
jgi:hypothetical protein